MKLNAIKLKGNSSFTTKEAQKLGISPQLLRLYIGKGLLERISHGVYRMQGDQGSSDLETIIREKLKAIPRGVIGMKTAVRIYGLTEELPAEIDIIVPMTNIPKRKLEDVILHPTKTEIYREDVKKIRGIPTTSLERTIVDLLRSKIPMSFVLSVYREAQIKKLVVSLTKLKKLARLFHAKRRVDAFIEAVL